MRYHLLGNSGLRVSEACLGTMTFGDHPMTDCRRTHEGASPCVGCMPRGWGGYTFNKASDEATHWTDD
jgi:aryl-alcohol dehydrogenase-like predicted oxidoreductase